jgi:hypothetical protein
MLQLCNAATLQHNAVTQRCNLRRCNATLQRRNAAALQRNATQRCNLRRCNATLQSATLPFCNFATLKR